MTTLTFTFGGVRLPDGRYCVRMYIHRDEPTYTELVSRERKAAEDAEQIMRDIVTENLTEDETRLLSAGDMPADALPIFAFCIGVSWDRAAKMSHYSRIDHRRLLMGKKWTPIATLAMELYDYTFGVVRKRENADRKRRNLGKAKTCADAMNAARKRFTAYCDDLLPAILRRAAAEELQAKRTACPHRVAGDFCEGCHRECELFDADGMRCREVEL